MSTIRLKSKVARNGQIVLPKPIRVALGFKHRDEVTFVIETSTDGMVSLFKSLKSFESLVGRLDENELKNPAR